MSGLTCPACHKQAMSCGKKVLMSPVMGFRCQHCSKVMAIDMKYAVVAVGLILLLVYGLYIFFPRNILAAVAVGIVLFSVLYCRIVPLVEAKENYKYFE